jgi:hypothetical protein
LPPLVDHAIGREIATIAALCGRITRRRLQAAANYLRLHVGAEAPLVRVTMSGLEALLDPATFLRSHRSTFVNIELR